MSEATCIYCAEALPPGAARCPACGEPTQKVSAAADLGPPRPLGPKLIALFSILFGGLGLLGPVAMIVMFTVLPADPNDPVRSAMAREPVFRAWTFVGQGLGFLAAVGLLASGIGILGWREWARRLAVRTAAFQLGIIAVGSLMTFVYVALPIMTGAVAANPIQQGAAIGGAVGGVCFGSIFPVATLLVLRRPAAREAFASAEAERTA